MLNLIKSSIFVQSIWKEWPFILPLFLIAFMSICSVKEGRRILDFHDFFMVGHDFLLTSQFCSLSLTELLSLKQEGANSELSCMHVKHSAQERQTFPKHSHKQKREKLKCIFVTRHGVQWVFTEILCSGDTKQQLWENFGWLMAELFSTVAFAQGDGSQAEC